MSLLEIHHYTCHRQTAHNSALQEPDSHFGFLKAQDLICSALTTSHLPEVRALTWLRRNAGADHYSWMWGGQGVSFESTSKNSGKKNKNSYK